MSVAKGFRLSDDSTASLDWNYVTKPDGSKSIIEEVNDVKQDLQDLQEEIEGGGSGMSTAFKQALHNILEKVAYVDEYGQTYLDALDDAMYPPVTAISLNTNSLSFASLNSTQQLTATTTPQGGVVTWSSSNESIATVSSDGLVTSVGYGNATITATSGSVSATCSVVVAQATLVSISAVYTQSGTVYDADSLDSLKPNLVVTAHWSNNTTSTVPSTDYTLSGTLTVGTSTITVTYGGKTTTFTVQVSSLIPSGYTKYDYITYDYQIGGTSVENGIITDISMSSEYILDTRFSYTRDDSGYATNTECIMGSRSSASGAKEFALFENRKNLRLGYWYGGVDSQNIINCTQGTVNHLIFKPVGLSQDYPDNAVINIDGVDYNTGATATDETWSPWFTFFGYGTSATSCGKTNRHELKIGRTQIKSKTNTILYDFIPVYNGTNYGFYERINEKFYAPQTPSNFLGGNWE